MAERLETTAGRTYCKCYAWPLSPYYIDQSSNLLYRYALSGLSGFRAFYNVNEPLKDKAQFVRTVKVNTFEFLTLLTSVLFILQNL